MKTIRSVLALGFTGILLFLFPSPSHAGTPIGTACWLDNFGAIWKISFSAFPGSNNFGMNGERIVGFLCNGTNVFPVTGTARVVGSGVVMGVEAIANQPGVCIAFTTHTVMPLATFVATGNFRNQVDAEGAITLTPIACPLPLTPDGDDDLRPEASPDDPQLVK